MYKQKLDSSFLEIFEDNIPELTGLLAIDGVYLAGGLLRTLFSDVDELDPNFTDVDLFFRDGEALQRAKQFMFGTCYHSYFICPEGKLTSYVYLDGEEPKWKVQFITLTFYDSPEEVIESFDFTVTGFATDGETLFMLDTAIEDTLSRHLKWNKLTYPASSLRRMMKYARKGYWMEQADYQWFVSMLWEHNPEILDETIVYVD